MNSGLVKYRLYATILYWLFFQNLDWEMSSAEQINRPKGYLKSMLKIEGITGFRACGKSLIAQIIHQAFKHQEGASPHIMSMDMSAAIRHFMTQPHDRLGTELQQYKPVMDAGGIIPDGKLIFRIAMAYLKFLESKSRSQTSLLLLAGAGRCEEEIWAYLDAGIHFHVTQVFGTNADMLVGVSRGQPERIHRVDSSSPEKIQRGWDDYQKYTCEGLKILSPEQLTPIEFGWSLRKKVTESINSLPIIASRKKQLLRRIASRKHPAWLMIEERDNPEMVKCLRMKSHQPGPAHSAQSDQKNGHTPSVTPPAIIQTTSGMIRPIVRT